MIRICLNHIPIFCSLQEALVRLMGRENFERYGGPIWQLKFIESFKVN